MPNDWLRTSLTHLYADAIDVLEGVIRDCPEDKWGASVWVVRPDDRHAWPIIRGLGEDLPDEERMQLKSAFWGVAYHVLFFLDHYLSGGVTPPDPPPPFQAWEQDNHVLPHRIYTKDELLEYTGFCRRKAASVIAEADFERPARIGRPFGDLLLNNLLQIQEHTAQLTLFLNREAGWADPRFKPTDRWFRACPDCQLPGSPGTVSGQ